MALGEITEAESHTFRHARRAWPVLFVLLVVLFLVVPTQWLWPLVVGYFALTAYLVFWPCPRCGRTFGLRFGFVCIAWPWVSECMHCGSSLGTKPSESIGT